MQQATYSRLSKSNHITHPAGVGKRTASFVEYPLREGITEELRGEEGRRLIASAVAALRNEWAANPGATSLTAKALVIEHGHPIPVFVQCESQGKTNSGDTKWAMFVQDGRGGATIECELGEDE